MHPDIRLVGPVRVLLLALICWLCAATALPAAMAQERTQDTPAQQPVFVRGKPTLLEAGPKRAQTFVPPSPDAPHLSHPASAMFEVSYEGFPDYAKTAFQYAVDLWGRQLTSPVPIRVRAVWSSFDRDSILAGAEPHMYAANFANAPQRDTLYPIALANKLAGYDLIPDGADAHDIDVYVNGDRDDWSFRTDGDWSYRSYDFVTLTMHELAHGLGFAGSMTVDDTGGRWGGRDGFPEIYDRFTVDQDGRSLLDTARFPNPSDALREQLTQKVLWNGPNGVAAAAGQRPELWAPSNWAEGSSYSHLTEYDSNEGTYNFHLDQLMTPYLDMEEVIHDPGAVTRGMLRDMGWTAEYAPLPGRPTVRLDVWHAFLDTDSQPNVPFINTNVTLTVTNYSGTATGLVVHADDAVVYDGPFTPDADRRMRLQVKVPGGETCGTVTLSAVLRNAEGDSEPAKATLRLDSAVQSAVSVTRPQIRPTDSPAEGPRTGGDAAYLSSDTVHIRVADERAGCAGVNSFFMIYEAVPQGTVPPAYGEPIDYFIKNEFQKEFPLLGRDQRPIVSGKYTFHVVVADKLVNHARFPAPDTSFQFTIDTTPPTARLEGDTAPPTLMEPGLVQADLSGLRVTDDLYRDADSGQQYWGYWVLVTPATVLPPSLREWRTSGVVVSAQARSLLWRIPPPRAGQPTPPTGYRMWVRVLDGAGNASAEVVPVLTPVTDPSFVHLPLVQR